MCVCMYVCVCACLVCVYLVCVHIWCLVCVCLVCVGVWCVGVWCGCGSLVWVFGVGCAMYRVIHPTVGHAVCVV